MRRVLNVRLRNASLPVYRRWLVVGIAITTGLLASSLWALTPEDNPFDEEPQPARQAYDPFDDEFQPAAPPQADEYGEDLFGGGRQPAQPEEDQFGGPAPAQPQRPREEQVIFVGPLPDEDQNAAAQKDQAEGEKSSAPRILERQLARKVKIDVEEMPLSDFVKDIRKKTGIAVFLDEKALDEVGIPTDTPVSLIIDNVSLRAALSLTLRNIDPSLCLLIDGEILQVTTVERESECLHPVVYGIADFVRPRDRKVVYAEVGGAMRSLDNYDEDVEVLVEVLSEMIEPDTWADVGGRSSIQIVSDEMIIVSASWSTHHQVAAVLDSLRLLRDSQQQRGDKACEPVSVLPADERAAAKRIEQALARRIALKFEDTPLADVASSLGDQLDIPVALDEKSLDEVGIGSDTPVTFEMPALSLRQGLPLLLRSIDPSLTYRYEEELLLISTKESGCEVPFCQVYGVLDLVEPPAQSGRRPIAPEELIKVLEASVDSDSWIDAGGTASAQYVPAIGALVVSQMYENHPIVEQVLSDVRDSQRRHGARRAAAGEAAVAADESLLVVYRLKPLMREAKASPPAVESPAAPAPVSAATAPQPPARMPEQLDSSQFLTERDADQIVELIKETIGVDHWPAGTIIRRIGNRIVVRQTRAAQQQILSLLSEMNLLEPEVPRTHMLHSVTPVVGFGNVPMDLGVSQDWSTTVPHAPAEAPDTSPKSTDLTD